MPSHPNARPHSWLVHSIGWAKMKEAAESHLRGRLVDIGCGTKPFRELVAPFVTEHVGVDHAASLHDRSAVDIDATAYAIPVPDESFDSALCSAVLEHLEEPERALRECFRVLRPGGVAIYTVPFIWHLHEEPRDFYRFSKYGLRYLFEKVGFEIVRLDAMSGFWVTFGQLLTYNLHRLNRGLLGRTRLVTLAEHACQGAALLLDRIDRTEQWTWMYLVVARRPVTPGTGS
jgi:SAM-dependent methyltransferase